ncbi:palmitoyltransferase ZDHHC22 [Xenopus laevis]|nr:palmitoyltransferase ZDHHC22 [Xenopus laevis]
MIVGVGYISESISLSLYDPMTFLRLLPLSITRFFSGTLLSSEMLVVLMIYLWFGVGIACAAFCCHHLILICRGSNGQQLHTAGISITTGKENLQKVFGKRWLFAIFVPQPKNK